MTTTSLNAGLNGLVSEHYLLSNRTDRRQRAKLWAVPVDDALALTRIQQDILPLPYLYEGLNLIPKAEGLSEDQLRQLRLLIGDRSEPYYYSNKDLLDFVQQENGDLEQAGAAACESWAGELSYDSGSYSSGGITVNSAGMAADKRSRANELRLRFGRG